MAEREGLTRKKRVRGGHRASATRVISQADEAIRSGLEPGASGFNMAALKQYKLTLQEKLEILTRLDEEILEAVEEEEVEEEIGHADVFKEKVRMAVFNIDTVIPHTHTPALHHEGSATPSPTAEHEPATTDSHAPGGLARRSASPTSHPPGGLARRSASPTSHPPGDLSRGSSVSPHSHVVSATRVKLPKLTLKKFNGDLTKWTPFWDSFESSIDHNPDLSEVDKFNYLNSLLEGPASEAISGLKLTAANYLEAIAILRRRFGNKQQIITKHMDVLLTVEPITSQSDLRGLRRLYDLVESQVRGLRSLGVASESYGSLLSSVLISKLPQELRLIVSREVTTGEWDLDRLMNIVEKEIDARERAAYTSNHPPRRPPRDIPTATALTSSDATPRCAYCGQAHSSNSCSSVTDPAERKKLLMKSGRCFACLRRYHMQRDCRSAMRCPNCGGRHHVSICMKGQPRSARGSNSQTGSSDHSSALPTPSAGPSAPLPANAQSTSRHQRANGLPTSSMHYVDAKVPVLLQTARACVYNTEQSQSAMEIRIILDSGSQRSYVTTRVKETLGLRSESAEVMLIKTFGSDAEKRHTCEVVSLGMKMKDGGNLVMSLLTVPIICQPLSAQPISLARDKYEHLCEMDLADFSNGDDDLEIDVLIGSDHYWKLVTGGVVRGSGGPTAIQTRVGWVLSGPVEGVPQADAAVNLISTHTLKVGVQDAPDSKQDLDQRLKMFWDLETLGIVEDELSVYEEFEKTLVFKDGRYEVQLPWKQMHPLLPDNRELSQKRLNGLLKRLRQNPQILRQYDTVIRDQINKGIVEVVQEAEAPEDRAVHYLPHHAVVREDKQTTKLRIVYDASAKSSGPSLNECLYTGPKFGQSLLDIILRFRAQNVALTADIEKAFLMVSVSEEDRDVLRFLWIDDITKDEPEIVPLRFTRVVFGVSSSPFLLNATISHHLRSHSSVFPETVQKISRSIYVDDLAYGAETEELAYRLYTDSKSMLKEGGFNLRKFVTNSSALQQKIDRHEGLSPAELGPGGEDESYTKATLGTTQRINAGETKVLGVRWHPVTDCFVFDFSDVAVEPEPTKRHIVGVASRFYDPLGFFSPVTIRFKVLFQELCASKVDWDEPLTGELLHKWKSLVFNLQDVSVSIPRCYFHSTDKKPSKCTLQGFCDASTAAYAAVIYLKVETENGCVVSFVASRTRVAPLKKQTIPRLELLSALLLAKLVTSVSAALQSEIPLAGVSCFTDSKVALFWITGIEKEWRPFVQNRVNEIRRLLPMDCWRHCPGKENPADIPSRGASPQELEGSSLWRQGPGWLALPVADSDDSEQTMPEECLLEMKAKDRRLVHSMLTTDTATCCLGGIICCKDYSSLPHLLRVTAYVMKFVKMLKCKTKKLDVLPSTDVTAADLLDAEILWLQESQRSLVEEGKFEMWKKQFGLHVDENGLLRCKGRLGNADLPVSTRHPVLLCKKHPLTSLVVREAHERVMHNGVKETLTEIRTKYWIVKGRQFVRQMIHKCVLCRRFDCPPYHAPPPPPLPEFRVNAEPPFTYTGVDFAGPLYVKTTNVLQKQKVWICLYTCCIVRAVHLDVVPDMTAEAFIRSFKRFTARRGFPRKMVSDNGKTFKSAAKTIASIVRHPDVQRHFAGIGMEWSFNVEKAPWCGGIFERMVRSTKRCLKKTIGRAVLSYDELLTALTEVEMILNSRPLSYVSTEDLEEPLTPSHLLTGRRLLSLPDCALRPKTDLDDDLDISPTHLTNRMKYLNKTLDHFWRRWRLEYLLELRDCHRYGQGTGSTDKATVLVGDIVLVHSDDRPRGLWRLARVENLLRGADGHVRGAVVRVHFRDTRSTLLRRPLKRLYPLEVTCGDSASSAADHPVEPEPQRLPEEIPVRRSSRVAAQRARDRIAACVAELNSEN